MTSISAAKERKTSTCKLTIVFAGYSSDVPRYGKKPKVFTLFDLFWATSRTDFQLTVAVDGQRGDRISSQLFVR